jgi:hypothetical protein
MSEQTTQAPQGNPADVFELNRAELQAVIDYLGTKPAAETFRLLAGLLSKPVARAAAVVPEVVPDTSSAGNDAAPVSQEGSTEAAV